MDSYRYAGKNDPADEARYSVRADSRLRMAFLGRDVAWWGESYVRLSNDDIGPAYEFLSDIFTIEQLLAQLREEAALHVLASGGTYKVIGEILDISVSEAEQRYAGLWAERQERHERSDDRDPADPGFRHLMRDLAALDAWCAQSNPLGGELQVSGGLVFPDSPTGEARTVAEVKDVERASVLQAETDARVAAYLEEREGARVKAMKRLANKPGIAKGALWGKGGGALAEYVIARDGRYLGVVRQAHYGGARLGGEWWHVADADPAVTWQQRDRPYPTIEAVIDFLDRNSPPPDAPTAEKQPEPH